MRGGRRRRYVSREDAAATCSGRWGPRRVRVTQCWATLTAEAIYTELLRDDPAKMQPGRRGSLNWTLPGLSLSLDWELRANAVWRFGRLFLRCPGCDRLATRIYVPAANLRPACRRCWGLTYESRQHRNYKDRGTFLAHLGFTHRTDAHFQTLGARARRTEACLERWAERREVLHKALRSSVDRNTPQDSAKQSALRRWKR